MFRIVKKISMILNKQQKVRVIIIGVLMFIGALLETLSVGMMLPLLTTVMDENIIETNQYVRRICEFLDIHSARTFIVAVLILMMILFVAKNLFIIFEIYVQNRFISNNKFSIKCEMLSLYLSRPYEDFLNLGTPQIQRCVATNVDQMFSGLSVVLSFFMELVTSVVLAAAIIVVNPLIALSVSGLLIVLMLLTTKVLKPFMRKYAMKSMQCSTQSSKWLLQSIAGIKELKVAGKEAYFQSQYNRYGKEVVSAERRSNVLSNVPRLSIETFCMVGMLGVLAIMLFRGAEISKMIPELGAFALAAVRLLPCANRMSGYLASVSGYEPYIDEMIKNREEINHWKTENAEKIRRKVAKNGNGKEGKPLTFRDKIELSNITYAYPNTDSNVLEGADMVIPIGASVGVVGGSGAGKTTAIDLLLGLLEPSEGAILADGVNIVNNYSDWISHIGYIPQTIYMIDDTIRANVGFGYAEDEIDDDKVWRALEEAQLKEFVESLPNGINTMIGERGARVSGGQRQRIGIARALYEDPEILIFDEATSALDNETEAAIMESINGLHGKKTMVIIAHRLTTIEGCDMVYRVKDGKIVRER